MTERTESTEQPASNGKRRDRRRELGPHSRLFRRGAVGNMDGNSAEAKFVKTVEAGLVAHLGRKVSIAQHLLIRRVSRAMLQLELLDAKQSLTDHDFRLASSLDGRVRLGLRELGLKAAPQGPRLAEMLAADARARREREGSAV
jgi:hypothetical protein